MPLSLKQDDILEIIDNALTGNIEARDYIYRASKGYIQNILSPGEIPGSYKDKEDVVCEIVNRIISRLYQYDPDKSSFKTWITNIKKHYLSDMYKHYDHVKDNMNLGQDPAKETIFHVIPRPKVFNSAILNEARKALYRIFSKIDNEDQRKAVLAAYTNPGSSQDWAEKLDVNYNTFRSRAATGLQKAIDIIKNNKEYRQIAGALEIIMSRRDGETRISDEELNLLEDETLKEVLKKSLRYSGLETVAKSCDLDINEYRERLNEALEQLAEKFKTYRGRKEKTEEISEEVIGDYLDVLRRYGLSQKTRSEAEKSGLPKNIKNLMNSIYYILRGEEPLPTTGQFLEQKLEESGISFDRFCEKLDIDEHKLAAYLTDSKPIPENLLGKTAKILDIPEDKIKLSLQYTFFEDEPYNQG